MASTSNEAPPDHVVNFGCGHPDASLLPTQEIADATQRALLGDFGPKWLQYGRENGNLQARQVLAEFLTHMYQPPGSSECLDPETLFFTSGVSHGVQLTCRTLQRMHLETNPQEANPPLCFVEDPTYFLIPPIFQQSGYELRPIHTNQSSGLDLDDFETKATAARQADPTRLIVLYSIPVHHNPLGVSLSNDSRQKLIQVCESLQVYLIADEVYHGLSFPDTPFFTPMATHQSNMVISCSAFTKILCPGIRCGWIQSCDLELLRRIGQDGVLDSGGCSSQLTSGIVAELIQSGTMASYMESLQVEYAKRCQHLCQALRESSTTADYQFEFEVPRGGYFLWVRVVGVNFRLDESFRLFCQKEYHVDFKTGVTCSSSRDVAGCNPLGNCIRLCFAYYDTASLTKGVKRLCQAIENYPASNPPSSL